MEDVQYNSRKRERWVITVFFFLSGILTATWASRIPDIQEKLSLNNASLGTVLFAIPLGLISGLSVAGWLVAKLGSKRVLLFSCIISCILLIIAGSVSSMLLLMVVLFFVGFARTIFNLSANTGALELQQQYQQPIISTFHGIWSLACFAAAGIGTVMIVMGVFPFTHFLIIAFVTAGVALVMTGRRFNHTVTKDRRPFFVKPDKYLFLLGLMALAAMLCEGAMFDWSVNYFDKVVKADKSMVTVGYMSFIIAMALGRLIGDWLIGSFGIYRMLFASGILMAIGFATAALLPFVATAALGFLLVGAGDSILIPLLYMLSAKTKAMSPAYALSSVALIGNTGFLIGPLFIGNVSQHFGMSSAFLALSIVSILMTLLSLQVKKSGQASESTAGSLNGN